MVGRLFFLAILMTLLSGCASKDLTHFREKAVSVQEVVIAEPEVAVFAPIENLHRKALTNEVQRHFSTEEMEAWKAYFQEHYSAEEVQSRLKDILRSELDRKGYRNVRFVQAHELNDFDRNGRVLSLQFKSLMLSGVAIGTNDRNKRIILTVAGRRVLRAGEVNWGDLHNTFISPRMMDERLGIVRSSDAHLGKELAHQRLDEALQRWMLWAMFPVPQQ